MSVKFSVVGIFYSTHVDLAQFGGTTVGNLIEYLWQNDPNFYRIAIDFDGKPIISMLGFNHTKPFSGRTGIDYPAGFYALSQTLTTPTANPYSVWQYDLADQNGVRQPTHGDPSYTTAPVQDGWSVIWRLVTISNGPGILAKRIRKREPAGVPSLTGKP